MSNDYHHSILRNLFISYERFKSDKIKIKNDLKASETIFKFMILSYLLTFFLNNSFTNGGDPKIGSDIQKNLISEKHTNPTLSSCRASLAKYKAFVKGGEIVSSGILRFYGSRFDPKFELTEKLQEKTIS